MTLAAIDIAIILTYIALTVGLGFWVAKLSSGSMANYFLAGNKLPWYALGLSNASGMFDVSGTMWMVGLLVIYGVKSAFIPWLWPVFNQIFLMVFLAIWLRRSGKLTGAEWISFRFGEDAGARASHIINVAFALITVAGYIAFSFLGIGKLAAGFFPYEFAADAVTNERIYGLIIVALTTLYVVKGGMYSVVVTEVLQFALMLVVCVAIGVLAMNAVSPEMLKAAVPNGWNSLAVGLNLGLDWKGVAATAAPENAVIATSALWQIDHDGYSLFGIIVGLMLFKGVFQSMAGPAPNYDMQRLLSARSPVEAAKVSGFVNVVLLFPRYMMIAGLGVLALVHIGPVWTQMQADAVAAGKPFTPDFDSILPFVLSNFLPTGLIGLVVAGLLAAFMSSFSASLNAAPAYLVNDIYRKYIKPDASEKTYVSLSILASAAFAVIGVFIGWQLTRVGDLIMFIAVGLYGGYTTANFIKWYWWRLNGTGYAISMALGIGLALLMAAYKVELKARFGLDELSGFPIVFMICAVAAVVGSYLTKPTDMDVLKAFYIKTRPWGFWGPVHQACLIDEPNLQKNKDFGRDMANVGVGIVWQTAITAAAIFMIIHETQKMWITLAVVAVCTLILKFNWWDRLRDSPDEA
ncbi:sodium:solute symporter family protein [Asticcacaulis machinosus]|uniref:Na+:solute symporter n=1 Tax=Asticcacaulis machinosus TaxID=2984211 RepID=A0ABT5HH48_9CAUL|nr:sodium:solute symporter family protein [Asticcacaulis machinosus]MDC7675576.1 Na+:solute symporter [Asticcacaulis machinosus]